MCERERGRSLKTEGRERWDWELVNNRKRCTERDSGAMVRGGGGGGGGSALVHLSPS